MHYHRCPSCYEDEPCLRYCYIEPSLSDPGAMTEEEEELNVSGAVIGRAHNREDAEGLVTRRARKVPRTDRARSRLRGSHAHCETCRPRYDAMKRLGAEV